MDNEAISLYLKHLSKVYNDLNGVTLEISICGGAALNLLGYIERVTKDIDIVSPNELPTKFKDAIKITADYFDLKPDWINQGPVDLLKMGLPTGFHSRCKKIQFYPNLIFLITSRFDQIHFKIYASIDRDRNDYHLQDLIALKPTDDELVAAIKWCFTHDVSDPFRKIAIDFLKKNRWNNVAKRISG